MSRLSMRSVSGIRSALIVALTLCSGLSFAAESEKFPSKAIRIVVPFAAGGGGDFIARAWADKLSDTIKQPVIVENRGGGNTVVGTDVVAKAAPDGYTLLLVGASIATNPALIEKLPYKTPEDFTPIGTVITYAMGLAARANLPANNVQELLALEKAQGPLSIATSGVGSATALAAELFKGATGVKLMAVPYKGAGPAAIDVASGHVDLLFTGMSQLKPHLDSGRLKLLATSGSNRLASAPEVQTIAEQGVKDFEAVVWWGILAPAKTPTAIVNKLNQALAVSLNHPDVMKRLAVIDGEVRLSSPQAFETLLKEEIARWEKLYKPQRATKVE
ncbi:MAG: tripartite tricarboxylate transporter substrate binding protein [Burkholderiaceae bacterium]|nr:tripartite tricarboxylate transporter substrate binding protein [Burkholderiaceae bacterium]